MHSKAAAPSRATRKSRQARVASISGSRPPEVCAPPLDHLGLLGHITSSSVTLEFFHNTPNGEELHVCLIKHGESRHSLSRRKTRPPLPILWVIPSARPDAGIDGLGFRPMPGGLRGIYESPPLHCTRLVVV